MRQTWKQKVRIFIQKRWRFLGFSGALAVTTLALSGCPATPVTLTTAPTTSTSTTSSPSVSSTQKKAFLAWVGMCQTANLAKYGALTGIESGKIPPSRFPQIQEALVTLSPLCNTYPSNPAAVEMQITDALSQLALAVGQNTINQSQVPIPSTSATISGAVK